MRFNYGHAVVCNGPFIEEVHGEHTLRKGGRCGLINREGELVLEAKYAIENRQAIVNYINSNNHCRPPPIISNESALCHAKRHVENMQFHDDDWESYTINKTPREWLIGFVERNGSGEEFTLSLDPESAHWISIVKSEKKPAAQ